jgi:hypothetical protein
MMRMDEKNRKILVTIAGLRVEILPGTSQTRSTTTVPSAAGRGVRASEGFTVVRRIKSRMLRRIRDKRNE